MSEIENQQHNINELTDKSNDCFQAPEEQTCDSCACTTDAILHEEHEVKAALEDSSKEEQVKDKKPNPYLDSFTKEMEKLSTPEAKVKYALDFMETSLAQSGTPHFKSFWEVRNICLQLFKENIPAVLRSQFWVKYSNLSKEARRLKELLDEQSSFAAEQIEIAITALEKDLEQFDEQFVKFAGLDLSSMPIVLASKKSFYEDTQKKLNLLNVQASRVNALRKELIKTEMRVRLKNKFFQRLSLVGDKIFPVRKDLIKDISTEFTKDVEEFITNHFNGHLNDSLFTLREDIKGLQGVAKILTLNTQAFTQTRLHLSECWDKLKVVDKERKKERAQLKATFKDNHDAVIVRITDLKTKIEAAELSDQDAYAEIDAILKFMRTVELGRDDIKSLKDQLAEARQPIAQRAQAQEDARLKIEQEKERERKEKIEAVKAEFEQIKQNLSSLSEQELITIRDTTSERIQNMQLSKYEKQELERQFKTIRTAITDALSEKEEQTLLALSDDDRQAINQLKEVLKQRKERRQEVKNQLENLRKAAGSSGFDFEKAMQANEQIHSEKERLEKINQGIKEIEDKLVQLQKKR